MNPVTRLHYFDGQRLDALDYRLEQYYHIQMRRRLNRGLFAPGVVSGLGVTYKDDHTVKIGPGLGLDPLGREIVVREEVEMTAPNKAPGPLGGYFLGVRYKERPIQGGGRDCAPANSTAPPSRVEEVALPLWLDHWPDHALCDGGEGPEAAECAIVLALVRMDPTCKIPKDGVVLAAREYSHATLPDQVRPLTLEGEKDIDLANPKILRFEISGGVASQASLRIWGADFSSYHYTQLGNHSHDLNNATAKSNTDTLKDHTHPFPANPKLATGPSGSHSHRLGMSSKELPGATFTSVFGNIDPLDYALGAADLVETQPEHTHDLSGSTATPAPAPTTTGHGHVLTGSKTDSTGATDQSAVSGALAYGFPNNLQVSLDNANVTSQILQLLTGFGSLGDGNSTHPIVNGTPPIDLLPLAPNGLGAGIHTLEFHVDPTIKGGCRVLWLLSIA